MLGPAGKQEFQEDLSAVLRAMVWLGGLGLCNRAHRKAGADGFGLWKVGGMGRIGAEDEHTLSCCTLPSSVVFAGQ